MSVVRPSGEQAIDYREAVGLKRITDDELQRARIIEMARLKELGMPTVKIAMKYRMTRQHVNRLIRFAVDKGAVSLARSFS